jgi:hypothetical protein
MNQQNLLIALALAALGLFALFASREMKAQYLPALISDQSDLIHQLLGGALLLGAYYFYNDQKLM